MKSAVDLCLEITMTKFERAMKHAKDFIWFLNPCHEITLTDEKSIIDIKSLYLMSHIDKNEDILFDKTLAYYLGYDVIYLGNEIKHPFIEHLNLTYEEGIHFRTPSLLLHYESNGKMETVLLSDYSPNIEEDDDYDECLSQCYRSQNIKYIHDIKYSRKKGLYYPEANWVIIDHFYSRIDEMLKKINKSKP